MSIKPMTFCKARGCTQLHRINNGYCLQHQRVTNNHDVKRNKESSKLYNNSAWKKYSKRLRGERITCANFRQCGGLAELVDHIKPISAGGDFWDINNHQVLCSSCHNKKRQLERLKR